MQNYAKREEERQINLLKDGIINDPGGKNGYAHYLQDRWLNLYNEIVDEVRHYFYDYRNNNWTPKPDMQLSNQFLCGNLKSSQACCFNHLFLLRKKRDYASAVLKNIDKRIVSAEIVCDGYGNDGYVEFESWGTRENNNPLEEKSHGRKRGKNSTSIDAVMVGKKDDGENILISTEWKYTEGNRNKCNYVYRNGNERNRPSSQRKKKDCIYRDKCNKGINCKYSATDKNEYHKYHEYFDDDNCPIKKDDKFGKTFIKFYFEPFYQLMRQTLWSWKAAKDFGCDEYIHLHIIPKENLKFRTINSGFKSGELPDVWKDLLKEPCRYKVLSPEELLSPLKDNKDLESFFDYLKNRYREKYV